MTIIGSGNIIQATGVILSFLASTFSKIFANEDIMISIQRQGPEQKSIRNSSETDAYTSGRGCLFPFEVLPNSSTDEGAGNK